MSRLDEILAILFDHAQAPTGGNPNRTISRVLILPADAVSLVVDANEVTLSASTTRGYYDQTAKYDENVAQVVWQ